jgi:hypothetical protein
MNIVGRVSSHAALGPFIVHRDAVDLDAKTHGGPQRRMTQITGHEPIMLRRHPTSSLISNPELPYRHHAKPNKPDPGNHFRKPAMPPLDDPRRERYAQGLADGKTQLQACAAAGFGKSKSAPSRLAKEPLIKARIGEILRAREVSATKELVAGARQAGVTKEWVLIMLRENIERAMQVHPVVDAKGRETGVYQWNGFVANKALELLGRELGMFVERHELTLAQRLADMPEDQRAAEMLDLVERARERLRQLRATASQALEGQ